MSNFESQTTFMLKTNYFMPSSTTPTHSPTYKLLLRIGPQIRPLTQLHAHIITTNSSKLHNSLPLLTKLLTFAISSNFLSYSHHLLNSIPNPDQFLFNTIIKLTSKSLSPLHSLLFYSRMLLLQIHPSPYTFTSVLKACADLSSFHIGKIAQAHALVRGFGLNPFVQTGLVVFYSKCGHLDFARKVFDEIHDKSIVSYNTMISGYEQNGFGEKAIDIFYQMRKKKNFDCDSATLVGVLAACAQTSALDLGKWTDKYIKSKGLKVDVVLGSALVNMYARCGHVERAREIFEGLGEKNVVAWTAMISGYGMHGYGMLALDLFRQMKCAGPVPNEVTFIGVLSACAHAGLVKEGCEVLKSMKRDYKLVPRIEHHVCMVDMYGRAGLLKEAMKYIGDDIRGEPGAAVWTAMVGACKMHKDFDLGVEVAKKLIAAEPENPGHYVLLSNIYALAGKTDQVKKVRSMMIWKRLKKQIGYSSVEVGNVLHAFKMGDTLHPQTAEIYKYLDELMHRIKDVGYEPQTGLVLHELEDEEREVAVRFHSEKLAVAFGILSTSDGSVIRIAKNLRICDDCHMAIKCISAVTGREIIIRDKHRFHHFKEGKCSCLGYW